MQRFAYTGLGWVVGLSTTVRLWDLSLQGQCPSWGSFKRILALIYASFREIRGKLRTARSTSATGD